jgi:HEPN domain-containing protein
MSDANNLAAWVDRAEEDYVVAMNMLRRKKPLTVTACFHAQQCAEKYLKAVLIRQGQPFPKTHDLLTLDTLCVQAGILLGFTPAQLGTLSSFAVQVRYPGDNPTLEEAREAVKVAKTVRRLIRKWLGLH